MTPTTASHDKAKAMTTSLYQAITGCTLHLFRTGNVFRRVTLVGLIKKRHPHLACSRLDLEVGQVLNRLVHTGELQRITRGGLSFYAPGKKYY